MLPDLSDMIDTSSPVAWDHPLNAGRLSWYLTLPNPGWACGSTFRDLCARRNGTLANMGGAAFATNGWRPTSNPGGSGSLLFDGTAGNVGVPLALSALVTASFSAWANLSAAAFYATLLGGNNGTTFCELRFYSISLRPEFAFGNGGPEIMSATALTTGTWHQLTATIGGGVGNLYVDGLLVATGSLTTSCTFSSMNMGARSDSSHFFSGQMNDVSIWNRVLSASEVWANYSLSKQGYPGVLNRIQLGAFGSQNILPILENYYTRLRAA